MILTLITNHHFNINFTLQIYLLYICREMNESIDEWIYIYI